MGKSFLISFTSYIVFSIYKVYIPNNGSIPL